MRKSCLIVLFVISTCLFLPLLLCSIMVPLGSTDTTKVRFVPFDALRDEKTTSEGSVPPYYTYTGLRDTFQARGASCEMWVYENDIDSHSKFDYVAFALTLTRPHWFVNEYLECGYYQDNSGYWFYTCHSIKGFYIEHRHKYLTVLPESRAYSLKLLEVDGRFDAYIDGMPVDSVYFSDDVSEERIYAAQGESSDPSNPMKGHFWNLMYYSTCSRYSWMNIEAYQDKPYYARLSSTNEYHATLMGDASLDYLVGIVDAGLVSAHFYLPPYMVGPLGYAAKADFNHDGFVDCDDAVLVNGYWGESW